MSKLYRCEAVVYRARFIPGDGVDHVRKGGRSRGRCRRQSVFFGLCVQHYKKHCTQPVEMVGDPMRNVDTSVPTEEGIGDD